MNDDFQDDALPVPQPPKVRRIALRPVLIIIFLLVILLVVVFFGWPYLQTRFDLPRSTPISVLFNATDSGKYQSQQITPTPSPFLVPSATLPFLEANPNLWSQGLIVLSIQEGLDTHLFAYQPLVDPQGRTLPLTRLTSGSWQDITPALSPKSDSLAFASNRSGFWNIYKMDLTSGEVNPVTNDPAYVASPSWSPDGLWWVYEALIGDNLDIFIQPADGSQEPIQLTNHPSADCEPVWGPNGRQIAFVSARGGRNQIWLANLDESGSGRFLLLSGSREMSAAHPVWSPDGRYLAWSAVTHDGLHRVFLWDKQSPSTSPVNAFAGDWAAWSPKGKAVVVVLNTPFDSYLTVYSTEKDRGLLLPLQKLPGQVNGLLWADAALSGDLVLLDVPTTTPLCKYYLQEAPPGFEGRWDLVELVDVEAPFPRLHERVSVSFQAFRMKLTALVGWDLLVDLENAFIPLSSALSPGLLEDWLYTGRAFTINSLPINAGWMAVVREDYGQETYWRVYLRTRFQDGSQGRPLNQVPWDFNARYSGVPKPYEQGGDFSPSIPTGYWVDMTRVAAAYGWQRFAALSTWRVAYPSARFNEFAFTEGLTWESAMLEIYPPEVLLTLTPLPTATLSLTPVPLWYPSSTPTTTPSLAATVTLPTNPTPSMTHTPTLQENETLTSEISPTSTPSGTMTTEP